MDKKAAGMPEDESGPGRLAQYAALSQVGVEMVAPILVGVFLDFKFEWAPWGSICGTILGLLFGIVRLVTLQQESLKQKKDGTERQGEK